MCCEALWAPCPVGVLACEAARLVVERRGIEESDPSRFASIDLRLSAIEAEAGQHRASSQAGRFLQACIGHGDATGEDAKACLKALSSELAISTMRPLLAYYVDPKLEGPRVVCPHLQACPAGSGARPGA